MLDVARHFLTVDEVKRYIDLMTLHKLNRLHLHLSDDQGWRIDIRSWPDLATHGGSSEVGGGTGGFYSQDQYAAIVRYAAERFITIVPEIDMPGHTNAALASYAELNCDNVARPLYTGIEVGFSALCVDKDVTYKFIDDVDGDCGVDAGTLLSHRRDDVKTLTAPAIPRPSSNVSRHRPVAWQADDRVGRDRTDNLLPTSIVQHCVKTPIHEVVAKGAKVIMSPAGSHVPGHEVRHRQPIGLSLGRPGHVKASYDWDLRPPPRGSRVIAARRGSAALGRDDHNIRDYEFLAFRASLLFGEIGWSPQRGTHVGTISATASAPLVRADGARLNFYRSPEIPWRYRSRARQVSTRARKREKEKGKGKREKGKERSFGAGAASPQVSTIRISCSGEC